MNFLVELGFALLAAQPAGGAPAPGNQAPAGDGSGFLWVNVLPFVLIAIFFYLFLVRPQRGEQAKRQDMLAGIKKNDRVITIGGIYGVVTNVDRDADEVTIKVDEATNTKLRMQLSAIARVATEGSPDEASNNK
ncbi:MAG: preprotein translocase subunit YajC [Planctomycetota bacterium]